jgi:ABC-type transport system substrate-binding protein
LQTQEQQLENAQRGLFVLWPVLLPARLSRATGKASPPSGAIAGRFDIGEFASVYSNDPDDSSSLSCAAIWPNGANFGAYCNHALDTLYQQELATPDPGVRQNIFDQEHTIYAADLPCITLFSPLTVTVVRKGTYNFDPSPIDGETINVWQWWCPGEVPGGEAMSPALAAGDRIVDSSASQTR